MYAYIMCVCISKVYESFWNIFDKVNIFLKQKK